MLDRVRLTVERLLRTWRGRLVFAAGLAWLPIGVAFLRLGADQEALLGVAAGVTTFGVFLLVLGGWGRHDDPTREPGKPGVWGSWDWRPDAFLVAGLCLLAVGVAGIAWSLI